VDAARRTRSPERDVAIILLLMVSRLRVSELCGLTVDDVDHGEGELWITAFPSRPIQQGDPVPSISVRPSVSVLW
jgi:integrase